MDEDSTALQSAPTKMKDVLAVVMTAVYMDFGGKALNGGFITCLWLHEV